MKMYYVGAFIGLIILGILEGFKNEERRHDAYTQQKAKDQVAHEEALKGYPASESELEAGRFYLCHIGFEEVRLARTNRFVVFQEVLHRENGWAPVSGQMRLYELGEKNFATIYMRSVYWTTRTNDVTTLRKVSIVPAGPVPQINKPPESARQDRTMI